MMRVDLNVWVGGARVWSSRVWSSRVWSSRVWIGGAFLGLTCTAVVAQSPSSPTSALPATLEACTKIVSNNERLQCFDRESAALAHATAPGMAAGPTTATAPGSAAAPATAAAPGGAATPANPAVALTPEQRLGLSGDRIRRLEDTNAGKPATPELKNLQAHITEVSANSVGHYVFVLDNGQVWHQIETRSSFSAMPGVLVTLSRGALGSFWISTGPHNSTRVERVK